MRREGWITVGRLELWWNFRHFDIGLLHGSCRCYILSLGYVGITWRSKRCR